MSCRYIPPGIIEKQTAVRVQTHTPTYPEPKAYILIHFENDYIFNVAFLCKLYVSFLVFTVLTAQETTRPIT